LTISVDVIIRTIQKIILGFWITF